MPTLLSFNNAYEEGRGLTTTVETNGSPASTINEDGLFTDSIDDQCLIYSNGSATDAHSIELSFNVRRVNVISLLNSGWREILNNSVNTFGYISYTRVRLYNSSSVVFDTNTDDYYLTRKINYDQYGWAFADNTLIVSGFNCDGVIIDFQFDGSPSAAGEYGKIGKIWLGNAIPIDVGHTDKLTIKYDDKSVKVESDGGQLYGTKKQVLKQARFVMPAASYEDVFGDGNSVPDSKFNSIFETNGTVAPVYFIMYKGDKTGGATELTTLQMYSSLENMPVLRTIGSRSEDNMPDWSIEFNLRERR